MNPTDHRIDRLLHALATAPAPAGLEQRVSARVAQRTAERDAAPLSKLRAILHATRLGPYAIAPAAVTVLAAVCLLVILHSNSRQTAVLNQPISTANAVTYRPAEIALQPLYRHAGSVLPASRTPAPPTSPPAQQDPDSIALNETYAPSHPAPLLPLTAQEALLLRSTRRGQPMEVAELDTLREAALMNRAAEQQRARLRDTIQGLLGPLATAQALTPPFAPAQDSRPMAALDSPTR
jgi:hypothetical protein